MTAPTEPFSLDPDAEAILVAIEQAIQDVRSGQSRGVFAVVLNKLEHAATKHSTFFVVPPALAESLFDVVQFDADRARKNAHEAKPSQATRYVDTRIDTWRQSVPNIAIIEEAMGLNIDLSYEEEKDEYKALVVLPGNSHEWGTSKESFEDAVSNMRTNVAEHLKRIADHLEDQDDEWMSRSTW